MPISTFPVKITVNCKKHGELFSLTEKCNVCEFLLNYRVRMTVINKEIALLNATLENFMRTSEVVAVDFGGKFFTTIA